MKVFISGGTGLVGQALVAKLLGRGDEVVVLTRSVSAAKGKWPEGSPTLLEGDPCYEGKWQESIAGCDAVVNLAGHPLSAERWNSRVRQIIHDSRTDSTRFVAEAIAVCAEELRPQVLVSASGIDNYAFAEVEIFDDDEIDESCAGGESFLAGLCWDWEDETKICAESGVRVVLMRMGVVLARQGGALPELIRPFRLGVGGRFGSGTQWMSWVHLQDVVGAYIHAIDSKIQGPVNVVAPGNVRNHLFAKTLGSVMRRGSWMPVPSRLVMAVAGQFGEYVLKGRRAVPKALQDDDFQFQFPELREALQDLL